MSLGVDELGRREMKTYDLDTMIAPRADATPYSQRFLAALDAGGAWSREARAILQLAAQVGVRLDEETLLWSDIHDLQMLRLFLRSQDAA